jgi:hypothetical protein
VLLEKGKRLLMAILINVKPLPVNTVDCRALVRDYDIEQHEPRVGVQGSACLCRRCRFRNRDTLTGIVLLAGGGMNYREQRCGGKQKKKTQESHDNFLNLLR